MFGIYLIICFIGIISFYIGLNKNHIKINKKIDKKNLKGKIKRQHNYNKRKNTYLDYLKSKKINKDELNKIKNNNKICRVIYHIDFDELDKLERKYKITYHGLSTKYIKREHRPPSYSKFYRVHWKKWESISNKDYMIVQTKRTKVYKYYKMEKENGEYNWKLCEMMRHHRYIIDDIKSFSNEDEYGKKFYFIPLIY